MKYKAVLYDPKTDTRAEYVDDYSTELDASDTRHGVDAMHYLRFMWEDGNYSCDCNRLVFMKLEDQEADIPCGQRVVLESLEWVTE